MSVQTAKENMLVTQENENEHYDQEQAIKKAMDELQRSNKDLEEFAYVASHDLQEPLRKISTFSGRLADKFAGELGEEGNMYIDRIMNAAENMRVLIDNLLEFSRITRLKQPFVDANLNFILRQVKQELELNIEETGTTINAVDLPVVEASTSQMNQLFNNIINNAIKFHKPDQPPAINISSDILTDEERSSLNLLPNTIYHKIRFCDNGIGFEDEYATKIFQIFQRLHGKADYPGSGIGLAICKKIMDRHNGIIFAENVKEGACFTVILPEKQH